MGVRFHGEGEREGEGEGEWFQEEGGREGGRGSLGILGIQHLTGIRSLLGTAGHRRYSTSRRQNLTERLRCVSERCIQ